MTKNLEQPLLEEAQRRLEEGQLAGGAPADFAPSEPGLTAEALSQQHELQVHKIELHLQNEQLRQANEELEAARREYEDLFEFAPVGYLTLDEHALIGRAN